MYRRIIKFWFEDVDSTQWFKKDEKFDHLITLKFSDAHKQATQVNLLKLSQKTTKQIRNFFTNIFFIKFKILNQNQR